VFQLPLPPQSRQRCHQTPTMALQQSLLLQTRQSLLQMRLRFRFPLEQPLQSYQTLDWQVQQTF
jgi:hypothetical protein